MKNKKILIALITLGVLLMSGFGFAETLSERGEGMFQRGSGVGGFFSGMGGHHRRAMQAWDGEDSREDGEYGPGPCVFQGEMDEQEMKEYHEKWLAEGLESIEESLEAGDITEEEALRLKERLEERSPQFDEDGNLLRGHRRGGGRGHMW